MAAFIGAPNMQTRGLLGLVMILIATASWAVASDEPGDEPGDGLVVTTSPHGVAETAARAEAAIAERGLGVFARIDHAAGATKAGLELPPTELLIFGNPTAGTRLMQCNATVAIDLPLKLLIWQGADGVTQVAYNAAAWLETRHSLGECAAVLENIDKTLAEIAAAATK
jgi:uncharacterized protein (DUF302 family)